MKDFKNWARRNKKTLLTIAVSGLIAGGVITAPVGAGAVLVEMICQLSGGCS
jgi:hypothetical protein